MIRDQRHMQGPRQHGTIEDVRAYWRKFASEHGFIGASGLRIPGELVDDDRTVVCYVSCSRWVADCAECGGGIACWPEQHGHAACLDCGHVFEVEVPADAAAAVAVLLARPDVDTRNWFPQHGETVDSLKVENITRALPLAARV